MTLLLLLAAATFSWVAVFSPSLLLRFAARRRVRAPHTGLMLVFRLWFAMLACGTVWLLLDRPPGAH